MQQGYGGDTFNTAVYLARCGAALGQRALYATALGDDRLSAGLLQRWEAEGIDCSLVRRIPEDVSILSKFWHGAVEKQAKKKAAPEWEAFAKAGIETLEGMK